MSDLKSNDYLYNNVFVEELFVKYKQDPNSVDPEWARFFASYSDDADNIARDIRGASWKPNITNKIVGAIEKEALPKKEKPKSMDQDQLSLSIKVARLIDAYMTYGHIKINYDPLNLASVTLPCELDLSEFSQNDLNKTVNLQGEFGLNEAKVSDVINLLDKIYASRIGVEFMYLDNYKERKWFKERFEQLASNISNTAEERKKALKDLTSVDIFEGFLHTRFPGAKRFSVEGTESVIPAVEIIISLSVSLYGIKEVVMGMAHRGRLSTLTKVMQKPYASMFSEFKGELAYPEGMDIPGDVKYHLGYSNDININGKKAHLSLTPNPSHLEVVNSVVLGRVRAKQDIALDQKRTETLGLLLHGDAAFAGQGSVYEALSLSQLEGYKTGGTLHIVINNQIGFTTLPKDARSSRYSTDVAKAISSPVIHVNAEDMDAVIVACKIAAEYRALFQRDIVIDLIGYRKYGHNEGDEPMFTQPVMYSKIKVQELSSQKYLRLLIGEGVITSKEYEQYVSDYKSLLEKEFELSQTYKPKSADWLTGRWKNVQETDHSNPKTGVDKKELLSLIEKITSVPKEFALNPKVERLLHQRKQTVTEGHDIDWGTGEALAFASLLDEDYGIRITGQDAKRGTFSHRHAVLFDQNTNQEYIPLNNIKSKQQLLEVHNSNLSEFAVLGFEYGYSFSEPHKLVIWEAQFGDFANGAQVIIDQYISSGEAKWLRMNGLVLLLPHGYEGQGPEHSSARLERYLQLCAMNNMRVVNCTTPASFFHALRKQLHSKTRKPLIVMSPKSLLRHKLAVSNIEEFAKGTEFRPVIEEQDKIDVSKAKKLILCSGKVYYDLYEERNNRKASDIAIVRLEQLYPFPEKEVKEQIAKYKEAEVIWCQEEHQNMGAYSFAAPYIKKIMKEIVKGKHLKYIGRKESASPAVGYMKLHNVELNELMKEVFSA